MSVRLIACILTALASMAGAVRAEPWVTMHHPATGATVVVVGTMHTPVTVAASTGQQLISTIDHASLLYTEAADGLLAARRRQAYEAGGAGFVKEKELTGFARLCAVGAKMVQAPADRAALDSAPVILRAFTLESATGAKRPATAPMASIDISDRSLIQRGLESGKTLVEAETTEDIVSFASAFDAAKTGETFERMCRATQRKETRQALETAYAELASLWQAGRWDGYFERYKILQLRQLDMPEAVFDRLIRGRTARMLDRMTEHGIPDGAVIVVGAAHMGGPDGLITLLQQRGFSPASAEKP